ncbi:acyl-homoserine-lactone synthase [Aliiroseovarius sp. CAU 1755]
MTHIQTDLLETRSKDGVSCVTAQMPQELFSPRAAFSSEMRLISQFLDLRKRVFALNKGWKVWISGQTDLDQYDRPDTVYIIAVAKGTNVVVGGARLVCTNSEAGAADHGLFSYMIRDACRGLLDGLPIDLCTEIPPVDRGTWELTRLVTDGTAGAGAAVLRAANAYLAKQEAERCLFLGPVGFQKMARSMGYAPTKIGPICGNRDGRFQAFACPVLYDEARENTG